MLVHSGFVSNNKSIKLTTSWWRHQMETISALLALCVGNSPVPVNSPHKRPVTRSFDLRLNKRMSKQPWGCWFETLSWTWWRHETYTRHWILSSLLQVMVCRLLDVRPLPKLVIMAYQLDLRNKLKRNLNHNTAIIKDENAFENVV